jgi:hypothetical protein
VLAFIFHHCKLKGREEKYQKKRERDKGTQGMKERNK